MLLPHRHCHKASGFSPDHHTENQIDHIIVRQHWKNSLQHIPTKREADIWSDNHLAIAKLRVKVAVKERQEKPRVKYDVSKLKRKYTKQAFQLALHNRFETLQTENNVTVEQSWENLKRATVGACKEVLGLPPAHQKPWISDELADG